LSSSSTDKTFSSKNALNVRLGHKLSATISTGDYQSRKAEWWVEQDLPSGETIESVHDAQEEYLRSRVERWKQQDPVVVTPNQTSVVSAPEQKTQKSRVSPQRQSPSAPDPNEIDRFPWASISSRGASVKADDHPGASRLRDYIAANQGKPVIIGSYEYRLGQGPFLNRFRRE